MLGHAATVRNLYDIQSLAYLVTHVALIVFQWLVGFHWWAYLSLLFLSIGIQIVHHNHVHLGIWFSKKANFATSLAITILTGVPTAMVFSGHIKNHHVHQHGPKDHTRTYRFGGDHNHLWGYLLHPFQSFGVLIPEFWREFIEDFAVRTRFVKEISLQVILVGIVWSTLLILDWQKFLLFVLVPQLFGLHWFLGANYIQHAHCDDASKFNYARNFTGVINWVWFNIGFHTAHHDHPKSHWSELRKLHAEKVELIDERLNESSFAIYVLKTYFLGSMVPGFGTKTLREGKKHGRESGEIEMGNE